MRNSRDTFKPNLLLSYFGTQIKIPIGYDDNFRSEFISDRNCILEPSEIRSDLIFDQISDPHSDRISFPIGFPVGFLSTFRSDPIVLDQNFRSDILRNFGLGNDLS